MGYALFTARKLSLQAKVNDYNLQLMKLSNEETKLANMSAARQKMRNGQENAQNVGSAVAQGGTTIAGGIIGFALGGPIGALIGAGLGKSVGQAGTGIANGIIDQGQAKGDEAFQTAMAAKQKAIDTEKQRLTTLINAAQNELQQVEKTEESAIKSATPKYVA